MIRVGLGYDAHPLVAGRPLVVGGVLVPYERGLAGHSDSDVVAHAIVEALLGAARLGDIGTHFPPGDPEWKDADSMRFLVATRGLLDDHGWKIGNLDATIVAEAPRFAPYLAHMCANLGRALGIAPEQISLKGKSTNGLGFEGRGEGIAAHAVALVESVQR